MSVADFDISVTG